MYSSLAWSHVRIDYSRHSPRIPLALQLHLAADRLVMEGLLSESLTLLSNARPKDTDSAAALLALAGARWASVWMGRCALNAAQIRSPLPRAATHTLEPSCFGSAKPGPFSQPSTIPFIRDTQPRNHPSYTQPRNR